MSAGEPPAATPEQHDVPLQIGDQVRELRRARGLTITELAQAINRSVGYVSQIERGISAASVPVLQRVAAVLGVQIGWFFQGRLAADPRERDHVVRRQQRRQLTVSGGRLAEELLSPTLGGELEMVLSTFRPGASSGDEPIRRDAEEGGLLLSGTLELWIDGRHFVLEEGDSFRIGRDEAHRWRNSGSVDAVVVWVLTPPVY